MVQTKTGFARLAPTISCHAWKPDYSELAISPNSSEVWIFDTSNKDASKWKKTHTLTEHDSFVSGMDWSSNGMLVTCGHDRNAYVWKFVDKEWKPELVILRISRAATSVQWSPSGTKFAVSSGSKYVAICFYNKENNVWVSEMIKRHKSTVLSIDWHPNSKFIVTGSTDFKCRVFSAFLDGIEEDIEADIWAPVWPKHNKFGAMLAEFDQGAGWVEAVKWSPNGYSLAFIAHDSSINFASIYGNGETYVQTIRTNHLPFRDLIYVSQTKVVAGGYDNVPYLYENAGNDDDPKWSEKGSLDKGDRKVKVEKKATRFNKNFSRFQTKAKTGVTESSKSLDSLHQNAIVQFSGFLPKGDTSIVTVGLGGIVATWST